MSHYDSDGPTLIDGERHRRRRRRTRYRSPSEDPYSKRRPSYDDQRGENRRGNSTHDVIGKVAMAVGVISVVAGVLHLWQTQRNAEREREYQRKRRKEFERAKRARRREEDKRERQQDWSESHSPAPEVKRIACAPSQPRSRSQSRAAGRNDRPPPRSGSSSRRNSVELAGYESDRMPRAKRQ